MFSRNSIPKKCFHASVDKASCHGKIIESHTVSKSGSLKRIAPDSFVFHFKPDINALFKNNVKLVLQTTGIGQASTFPGFCGHHDKELFSPIEDRQFETNHYNCMLLGYRALTKEIYAKEMSKSLNSKQRVMDRGADAITQVAIQQFLSHMLEQTDLALRDLQSIKGNYDQAFVSGDYSSVHYLVVSFEEDPSILFSGSFFPEFDFSGERLQTFETEDELDSISVNAISLPKGGAVVFQWMGESDVNTRFICSLLRLESHLWGTMLVQFAFESFENLFISKRWWSSLSDSQKEKLNRKVQCKFHSGRCFQPDGEVYCEWQKPTIETTVSQINGHVA